MANMGLITENTSTAVQGRLTKRGLPTSVWAGACLSKEESEIQPNPLCH